MKKLTRRGFVKAGAGGAAAMGMLPAVAALAAERPANEASKTPWPENGTLVPDEGWTLWCDREAAWRDDEIFLPDDVAWKDGALCGAGKPLPVHAPTGGWDVLRDAAKLPDAKEVVLPTTVEQHFWGAFGQRPYTPEEYRYAATTPPAAPADDDVPQNGAYFGVSWWWRAIDIPASMAGRRIFLHVRGARLRAEVYLNGKLCGYSIMEELPFEADLTAAANPGGENMLAVRITNPFGRFDWVDGTNAKWGKVALYRSHGFGGLDRGMTVSAHDVRHRILDAWVLNTPNAHSVEVHTRFETPHGEATRTRTVWECIDGRSGATIATNKDEGFSGSILSTPGMADATLVTLSSTSDVFVSSAEEWTLDNPRLYRVRIRLLLQETDAERIVDERTLAFGFRSFAPQGLGSDSMFRLNGKRIRLYSAISWGFWGLNGLFPVPELAVKEVTQAKALGLNCLNFHRNVGKEEVFRAHDEFGLLRYMEPGGGKLAIGKLPAGAQPNAAGIVMERATKPEDVFAQKFMVAKCVAMVRAFRSHPSLILYTLQNEIGADLNNPETLAVLKAMHEEDPSRCIVLNDGFVAPPRKAAQAWYEPWSADETGKLQPGRLHRSDQEPWGGWWNQHQGAGDQWYDEFYKSPAEYTYKSPEKKVLSEFGEMEGCATPDNHSLMVDQIRHTYAKYGGASYDLRDHAAVDAATAEWLTRWRFREGFPSTERLWNALGKKCYDTWQNYLENARLSDELDFTVISGWESTVVENHSGIVDNLRNFKSDPATIAQTLAPVHPVAKQRSACVRRGESAVFDLYLLNDTSQPLKGELTFAMVTPGGRREPLRRLPAPSQNADVFSYLLEERFATPPLVEEGMYRFTFSIAGLPRATQTKELWVTGVDARSFRAGLRIGVTGVTPMLRKQLAELAAVEEFVAGKRFDVIVSSGLTSHTSGEQQAGETTGLEAAAPSAAATRKQVPGEANASFVRGHLQRGVVEAVRAGTPLLAIPQADALSDGVAAQLAEAGAFRFAGNVGDFRAPWMGNWYFVRRHALYAGLPVDRAMGFHYQVRGREANGLLVEGDGVEVVAGYSRDHDRRIGAGTFTAKLGAGRIVYHRVPAMHSILQQRFLANALHWLTERA